MFKINIILLIKSLWDVENYKFHVTKYDNF